MAWVLTAKAVLTAVIGLRHTSLARAARAATKEVKQGPTGAAGLPLSLFEASSRTVLRAMVDGVGAVAPLGVMCDQLLLNQPIHIKIIVR